jgi:hypothetical protein
MSLLDRIRRLWGGRQPDHPLSEQERHEHPPETAFDVRGEYEREFVGKDFDPDEPRSGRL